MIDTSNASNTSNSSNQDITAKRDGDSEQTTAGIQRAIETTQANLTQTLSALESRVPDEVMAKVEVTFGHIEERTRALIGEQIAEAKKTIDEGLREAKSLLHEEMSELEGKAKQGAIEASAAIKSGLHEAKESVKKDLREAFTDAKASLRASTVGRVEALATTIGDKMEDTRITIVDTVRQNPIPTALMGAGLVWLLINRSRSARGSSRSSARPMRSEEMSSLYDNDQNITDPGFGIGEEAGRVRAVEDAVGKVAHQASEMVGEAIHGVSDLAARVASTAQGKAKAIGQAATKAASRVAQTSRGTYTRVATGARSGASRAQQGFNSTLEENPLVLAGAALAIGALVGAALPRSRRENQMLGPSRDRIIRRAGAVATDAAKSFANIAEETLEGVRKPIEGALGRS